MRAQHVVSYHLIKVPPWSLTHSPTRRRAPGPRRRRSDRSRQCRRYPADSS